MTDSLIFIAERKSWDIRQTQKYSAHCDCSIKDGRQNATIVISLEKFDMILLFLRSFRVPFDWNNMSIYVVKYFYVDIGMIFSCRWHVDIIACRWQPQFQCIFKLNPNMIMKIWNGKNNEKMEILTCCQQWDPAWGRLSHPFIPWERHRSMTNRFHLCHLDAWFPICLSNVTNYSCMVTG